MMCNAYSKASLNRAGPCTSCMSCIPQMEMVELDK